MNKLLSWVDFFAIALVCGVIVAAVLFYTNTDTDIRAEESKILNQRIIDCLVKEDGSLNYEIKNNFDLYSSCNIDKNLFEVDLVYFSKIELQEEDEIFALELGNKELEIECPIIEEKNTFPDCYENKILLKEDSKQKVLKVTSVSANGVA